MSTWFWSVAVAGSRSLKGSTHPTRGWLRCLAFHRQRAIVSAPSSARRFYRNQPRVQGVALRSHRNADLELERVVVNAHTNLDHPVIVNGVDRLQR